MSAAKKELDGHIPCEIHTLTNMEEIKQSLFDIKTTLSLIQKDFSYYEKKLNIIDTRLWQIILLLLGYPLGLIVGKLTHIF